MNFLADESVERQIVNALRKAGHTVLYVAEMSPGLDDGAVLALANQSGSVLVTSDKDFGELVFRQKRIHQGVVLTRLNGQSEDLKAETLVLVVKDFNKELPGAFCVISPGIVRIRRNR